MVYKPPISPVQSFEAWKVYVKHLTNITILCCIICIVLYSLVWFDIVFDYLLLYCINAIEPCLWYSVLSIHFTILQHIISFYVDLEVEILWDVEYGYGLIWDTVVFQLLVAWHTHLWPLSLYYPKLLVKHDWLSLIKWPMLTNLDLCAYLVY